MKKVLEGIPKKKKQMPQMFWANFWFFLKKSHPFKKDNSKINE